MPDKGIATTLHVPRISNANFIILFPQDEYYSSITSSALLSSSIGRRNSKYIRPKDQGHIYRSKVMTGSKIGGARYALHLCWLLQPALGVFRILDPGVFKMLDPINHQDIINLQ